MTLRAGYFILAALTALALPVGGANAQDAVPRTGGSLTSFRSDKELAHYLRELGEARRRELERQQRARAEACAGKARVARHTRDAQSDANRDAVIVGRVMEDRKKGMAGVQLMITSLSVGTNSGSDGRFALRVPAKHLASPREVTLAARRIGFEVRQQTLTIGARDSVVVELGLCSAQLRLGEVVVTGQASASAPAAYDAFASKDAAESRRADESITNVQHAGVDEGGIVKSHGDHLVVLRRGRLFTVAAGDREELRPVDVADAYGPGIDPRGAWYDEMLMYGDRIVVIGYSYMRGGTEIGVFNVNGEGTLRHEGTYHLRSNDYYSSRNYASRLVGGKLVLYTPLFLNLATGADPLQSLPSMRRWKGDADTGSFQRIAPARRVYHPAQLPDSSFGGMLALHSVTTCDLAAAEMKCESTVVVGPWGHVFYVSPSAVYVWTSEWRRGLRCDDCRATRSIVYRLPLDGSAPAALGAMGSPVDQFSFLESGDGRLNVLVRSNGDGDWMWHAERSQGDVALLRVPVSEFGDGRRSAARWHYRALPSVEGYAFQNRFVGEYLLYGLGNGWGPQRTRTSTLFAVRWAGGDATELALPHGVDRIEAMGANAVVIGADGRDLKFTGIRLGGRPTVAQRYTLENASQGELRSHGFFYKPDGASSGTLGLPVRGSGRPGYEHLFNSSASILFLRNDGSRFAELGELAAKSEGASDDACQASCVDWYGNARPLFLRGRVFALLGYELVEGRVEGRRIRELRRVSFAPSVVRAVRR